MYARRLSSIVRGEHVQGEEILDRRLSTAVPNNFTVNGLIRFNHS